MGVMTLHKRYQEVRKRKNKLDEAIKLSRQRGKR
jgi:hypothetical protein